MDPEDQRKLVEEFFTRLNAQDWTIYDDLVHHDYVQHWPQSNERIVGPASARAINENYPAWPTESLDRLYGRDGLWVLEWTGDYSGTAIAGVSIFELKDDKIWRHTDYFAAPFEPPEWRSQWVTVAPDGN